MMKGPHRFPSTIKKSHHHQSTPDSIEINYIQNNKLPSDVQLIAGMKSAMNNAIKNSCYVDAIFFADKILTLSNDEKRFKAVYDLANCYFMNGDYQRCIDLLEKHQLLEHNERCQILTGHAYLKSGQIDYCIQLLERTPDENRTNLTIPDEEEENENQSALKGLKHLLLAKAYESQENNICAAKNYRKCLQHNCENFEAFDRLIGNYLLTHEEKIEFIAEIYFTDKNMWLKDYYRS